jgi:hypothetical protein
LVRLLGAHQHGFAGSILVLALSEGDILCRIGACAREVFVWRSVDTHIRIPMGWGCKMQTAAVVVLTMCCCGPWFTLAFDFL